MPGRGAPRSDTTHCSFGIDAQVPGGDYSAQALDVGLGLRPDHTGQGLGVTFLGAILAFAQERYSPTNFAQRWRLLTIAHGGFLSATVL